MAVLPSLAFWCDLVLMCSLNQSVEKGNRRLEDGNMISFIRMALHRVQRTCARSPAIFVSRDSTSSSESRSPCMVKHL